MTSTAVAPSIGVIAAGAVATTYHGPIVDLMGLNNVKMGHSPGNRVGAKNHAAFSVPVFWELQPDLVNPRTISDAEGLRFVKEGFATADANYLRRLMASPRFLERYRLIVLRRPGAGPYPAVAAYGRVDWLARHGDAVQWTDYAVAVQEAGEDAF
jgi:hypothetical protein